MSTIESEVNAALTAFAGTGLSIPERWPAAMKRALYAVDWRVLGGVIPGPIPAEWAREGDTIRDNGVTGTITRIVNTGRMVHLYIDSGHVSFAKITRQDFVRVISAEAETTNHPNGGL